MNIEELEQSHYNIWYKDPLDYRLHTNLSIQFTIEVLEDVAAYYAFGALPTVFIDDKIQELKQYLDGNN